MADGFSFEKKSIDFHIYYSGSNASPAEAT